MGDWGKAKVDLCSIANATMHSNANKSYFLKRAAEMADPKREERLKDGRCVVCFTSRGQAGGSACSQRTCGLCETVTHSGCGSPDPLCKPCAVLNGLCRQCGADIDLKQRRKPRPFQAKREEPS